MSKGFKRGQKVRIIGNGNESDIDGAPRHYLPIGSIAEVLVIDKGDVYHVAGHNAEGAKLEQYVAGEHLEPAAPFEVIAEIEV